MWSCSQEKRILSISRTAEFNQTEHATSVLMGPFYGDKIENVLLITPTLTNRPEATPNEVQLFFSRAFCCCCCCFGGGGGGAVGGGGAALFFALPLTVTVFSHSERMLSPDRVVKCSQTRCIKWAGECKTVSVEFGLFDTSVSTNEQRSWNIFFIFVNNRIFVFYNACERVVRSLSTSKIFDKDTEKNQSLRSALLFEKREREMCACVCVGGGGDACVRACVRRWVGACVRVCVRVCIIIFNCANWNRV